MVGGGVVVVGVFRVKCFRGVRKREVEGSGMNFVVIEILFFFFRMARTIIYLFIESWKYEMMYYRNFWAFVDF